MSWSSLFAEWGALSLEAVGKGSLVLLVTILLAALSRGGGAAVRYGIWRWGLLATLLVPLGMSLLPTWRAEFPVRIPRRDVSLPQIQAELQPAPGAAAEEMSVPVPSTRPAATPGSGKATPVGDSRPSPSSVVGETWPGLSVVFGVWLVGTLLLLGRLAFDLSSCRRLRRLCLPMPDAALNQECAGHSSWRKIELLTFPGKLAPMTWGWLRPVVVYPEAAVQWPPSRRLAVLHHELAHLQRGDWLFGILARIACALQWFNPLMWYSASRFSREQEKSCDERVLESGVRATDYASDLVAIARFSCGAPQDFAALAVVRPCPLEDRLRSILEPRKSSPLWRFGSWVAQSLLAAVLLSLAGAQVAARSPEASEAGSLGFLDRLLDRRSSSWTWQGKSYNRQLRVSGRVEVKENERELARLEPGAYLEIQEGSWFGRRKLLIEPDAQGQPRYDYVEGFFRAEFDAEARRWMEEMLAWTIPRSGLNAPQRYRKLMEEGGVDAVLSYLEVHPKTNFMNLYLEDLLASHQPSSEQIARILAVVEQGHSDRLTAHVLGKLGEEALALEDSGEYWRLVRTLDAGRHRRQVLVQVLSRRRDEQTLLRALEIVSDLPDGRDRFQLACQVLDPIARGQLEGVLRKALRIASRLPQENDRADLLIEISQRLAKGSDLLPELLAEASKLRVDRHYRRLIESLGSQGFLLAVPAPGK